MEIEVTAPQVFTISPRLTHTATVKPVAGESVVLVPIGPSGGPGEPGPPGPPGDTVLDADEREALIDDVEAELEPDTNLTVLFENALT